MKKVAIGLPVYNGANYLAAAIDSILAQSYGDFDFLISDNASTDCTEEICRSYAQRGQLQHDGPDDRQSIFQMGCA